MVLSVPSLSLWMFSLCLQIRIAEQKVTTVEKTQPGINVGPYIGNLYKLCGITFVIIKMAQVHVTNDRNTEIIIPVKETFLVIFKTRRYKVPGRKPIIQEVPQVIPMKQETPLPPLKLANTGKQCPNVHPKAVNQ